MSDNTPDFDNMSQEEIMAWMETLAKRQGASEGFTTSADMDIAEVDPNTVIDEPGYVPYGQERTQPVPTSKPIPTPQFQPPVSQTPPEPPATPVEEGGLAWLESLAADQGEDLFNLDLSGLPASASEAPPAPAPSVNPMTWLEDLARSQVAEPSLERLGAEADEEESAKLNPFAQGVNPMEWLETLARRQGAKDEELTTRASMNIPEPQEAEVENDDYQPFSFATPPARRSPEPAGLENPADWLNSLAGAEGYSEEGVRATQKTEPEALASDEMSLETIQDAIADGTVTRDQMQYFLDQQADQLEELPEEELESYDDETPIIPGDLPDWLSELKPQANAPVPTTPIDALFETPAAAEMPEWLRQDMLSGAATDLESIFEPEEEESRPFEPVVEAEAPAYNVEIDPDDPWTEAFDLEYAQGGEADISAVPDWYEQNVNDPTRIAAVEQQESAALEEAALPEEKDLAAAQQQAVPLWMTTVDQPAEEQPAASTNVFEDIPDWLKEVESSVSPDDVPDWLVETITAQEEVAAPQIVEPEPPVFVEQPRPAAPPPAPTPVPAPARIPVGEAAAVLERARDREQGGDLEGALAEYESMIRTSAELDAVVADLTMLVKSYKTTPAVYRVLGDGLMRQGKLQAALNTYREALNQL